MIFKKNWMVNYYYILKLNLLKQRNLLDFFSKFMVLFANTLILEKECEALAIPFHLCFINQYFILLT